MSNYSIESNEFTRDFDSVARRANPKINKKILLLPAKSSQQIATQQAKKPSLERIQQSDILTRQLSLCVETAAGLALNR